jgi:hypothetical protein
MSVIIVSDEEISAMLLPIRFKHDAFYYWHDACHPTDGNHHHIGQLLIDANLASYNERYDDDHQIPRTFNQVPLPPDRFSAVQLLKLLDYYEYQTAEAPDYEAGEARAIVEMLRHRLIRRLPGYEEAPWGIY